MDRTPKRTDSHLVRARRVADHLAEVAKESMKPGGTITLEEALRELVERERREATEKKPRVRRMRRARRS